MLRSRDENSANTRSPPMTIRIERIVLTKTHLAAIPEQERNLFVLLGHAANEINILSKLLHFASSSDPRTQLHAQAEQAQTNLIGSLLAGKVYELWNLLQAGYYKSEISRDYDPLLDGDTRAALEAMGRYFSRKNLIARVRNEYAFHYEVGRIADGFRTSESTDPFDIYLSDGNANSFYGFADTIAYRGMLEPIAAGELAKAIGMLITETMRAADWASEIMGSLMAVCITRHIAKDPASLIGEVVDLEDAPTSDAVRIPFFVELKPPMDSGQSDQPPAQSQVADSN